METTNNEERANQGSLVSRLVSKMSRPVSAPVVDLFRILCGLLVGVYYVRLFLEYSLYTSETGLLDHTLHRKLFWFTEFTLFFPGSPDWYKLGLLIIGFLATIAMTLGIYPKLGALVSWIIVVSVHRWNFAVINVDDSSITLLLWWLLFLPIGHTLTWKTIRGRSDWRTEFASVVDGFFVRAFFCNLFIYYLTAGLTKLGSELWREGLALFVILNLPLARTQGMWSPEDLPFLWVGNHFTLIAEPLFPFMVLLPKHSPLKYVGGAALFVFHIAIPVTIGVPYANFALILALVLIFYQELGDWFQKRAREGDLVQLDWRPPKGTRPLIASYLIVLFFAMQKNVPVLGKTWEGAMACLYLGGVAQEYHLFDWIDRFNWTVRHEVVLVTEQGETKLDTTDLFPHSVRGFIVQSYLLPMRWMRVPRPLTGEMRYSVLRRAAERLVRTHPKVLGSKGEIYVRSWVGRLDKQDMTGQQLWTTDLMRFGIEDGKITYFYPLLPEDSSS